MFLVIVYPVLQLAVRELIVLLDDARAQHPLGRHPVGPGLALGS